MNFVSNLRELAGGILRFGFGFAQVKGESSSDLSARKEDDAAYARLRSTDPLTGVAASNRLDISFLTSALTERCLEKVEMMELVFS